VLCACWLGLPPTGGRLFALGTASLSVLGFEHDDRVIRRWNQSGDPGEGSAA
jgi:probable phosphoglycerate mutase